MLFDQRVFYFPLKPRLEALMETKAYFNMCQHEFFRPKNKDILTDVYDSPAWKDFMGPCNYPNKRLGLLGCGDGFPAFEAGKMTAERTKKDCQTTPKLPLDDARMTAR